MHLPGSTWEVTAGTLVWLPVHNPPPLRVGALQQSRGTFSTLEAEGQVEEGIFFKHTLGNAKLPVGIILLLKGGLCLSLPPPNEAVNCNKRIWLNKFLVPRYLVDKELFEYGSCVWLLVMEWRAMFSLLLEFSPFGNVQERPFTRKAAVGSHGAGGHVAGELWPDHFLLINLWVLIIFLSGKLL